MEANKDLVRRWVDVFNGRDFGACSALAVDAYVEHAIAPFGREAPGQVDGPTHLRETAEWLIAQFPDVRMTIDQLVADGDIVAARVTSTGTNLGPLNGMMPPTGRTFTSQQSHWFRVADGKLAEHWANRDDLEAMLQLGIIVPPGRPK